MSIGRSRSRNDSIEFLTGFIRQNWQNPQAFLARGQAYAKAGKWPQAISDFGEAILVRAKLHQPADVQPYLERGLAYLRTNRPDKASLDFLQAVRLQPENLLAHHHLGMAYFQLGQALEKDQRQAQAISYYTQAILVPRPLEQLLRHDRTERKPSFARLLKGFIQLVGQAFYRRGRCQMAQVALDLAVADLTLALRLLPGHAGTCLCLGQAYLLLQNHLAAIEHFTRALAAAPAAAFTALVHRGLAYSWLGQTDKAHADFHRAEELDPNAFQSMKPQLTAGTNPVQPTLADISILSSLLDSPSPSKSEAA